VPISRLAECIVATEKDIVASFLPAPIIGHVGDGNLHLVIVLNPNDPRETTEAERLNERLVHSKDSDLHRGLCPPERVVVLSAIQSGAS
jgi:FAD/FMN-containing dehydrogenase